MNGIFQFVQRGGVMMYPLVLCSAIMLGIIIERTISLRRASTDAESLLEEIEAVYKPGADATAAIELASKRGVIGRIFARGLRNAHRPADSDRDGDGAGGGE